MSWRKTITDSTPQSWRDSAKEVPSEIESAMRGAAQGASLGFADEITGALESLKDVATTDVNISELIDQYEKRRDESRSNYKVAQETNPNSYMAGEIGGGIASAFVPVAGASGLIGKAALSAGQGAAAAVGMSEKEGMELVPEALVGASIGAITPVAFEKALKPIAKSVSKAAPKIEEYGLKKIGKTMFGVDEKATENYLRNSKDVNKAYSMGELAEAVLSKADEDSVLNDLRKRASTLSSKAWETLSPSDSVPKKSILSAIDDGQQALLVDGNLIGKAQTKAFNELSTLAKQMEAFPDQVSEGSLKRLIQTLDENVNWNNPEMGPTNDALRNLRTFIDSNLKKQNPKYALAMEETEQVTKALAQVKSVFENRLNPDSYDKFNNSVKNLVNKDRLSSANQAVDKIEKHTGYDLRKDIVDSWTKNQFEKGDVNGSRKTLLGGMIGTAAGTAVGNPVLGGAIGSSVGYTADRYSGPIFKKLLDGKLTASELTNDLAPHLGKFASPLIEASTRGNNAVMATHFLLQQNNPEYRELIRKSQGNGN